MAMTSKYKIEYIIIAVITVILTSIQTRWFIDPSRNPFSMRIFIGFLAEKKDITGIIGYIIQAFGLLIPFFIASIIYHRKYFILGLAFTLPFVFAFTIQATIDIAVNHKFIVISNILFGIFVAWLFVDLWKKEKVAIKISIVVITLFMTITGIVDLFTFNNMNKERFAYPKNNPASDWAKNNTKKQAVFLTNVDGINPYLYAGHPLYLGWTYYSWSSGYDVTPREKLGAQIYGSGTQKDLEESISKTNIDYIVINDAVRYSNKYPINEQLIRKTFPLVFESSFEDTKIYQVHKNP